MSLFSWFSRKPSPPKPRPAGETHGVLGADATIPLVPGRPLPPPDPAANRKNERIERRELLYLVVRDAMVRASVLSSSYKFKVLSLDQHGRQFLVMIDLAREYGGDTARLAEIEALIAQTAKARFDILVTAVYWRTNEHVAVGQPLKSGTPGALAHAHAPATGAPAPTLAPRPPRRPAPLVPPAPPEPMLPVIGAEPLVPPAAPAAPLLSPRNGTRYEPIEADEVAAFKRALTEAAATGPAVAPAPTGVSVRSGPRLAPSASTGFEDTEMPDDNGPSSDLSRTQYGDLH